MLKVDLIKLEHGARVRIDTRVAASDPLWEGAPPPLEAGLDLHLEARRSGEDVLVRGTMRGRIDAACRRCLAAARAEFEESLELLYRHGPAAAGDDEMYLLPARAREIDLGPAIREHALLAMPEYVLCREDCAGLCPTCGADLNPGSCGCTRVETDERWAALRRLTSEE